MRCLAKIGSIGFFIIFYRILNSIDGSISSVTSDVFLCILLTGTNYGLLSNSFNYKVILSNLVYKSSYKFFNLEICSLFSYSLSIMCYCSI